MSLPTQFLLYDPKRAIVRDRYAGFTLVKCTPYTPTHAVSQLPTYTLEIVPNQPLNRVIRIEKDNRWNIQAYPHSKVNIYSTINNGSDCMNIPIYDLSDHFKAVEHVPMGDETFVHPMPVMFASESIRDLFPPRAFKRNIRIAMTDPDAVPASTQSGILLFMNGMSAPSAQTPPVQPPPPVQTPPVQPQPVQPPRKKTPSQPLVSRALCPFVAKKLLELAVYTKQNTCPITLEELILPTTDTSSNVAVMPCGHIFSDVAITESFKITANRNTCPQCRSPGYPTFL